MQYYNHTTSDKIETHGQKDKKRVSKKDSSEKIQLEYCSNHTTGVSTNRK